jgi:hypothetical protein
MRVPIPSISTLISSPAFNTTFGSRIQPKKNPLVFIQHHGINSPIPGPVPVIITVPLSKVVPLLKNEMV